jgi:hypothetical protein
MELERRYASALNQTPQQGFIALLAPIVVDASLDLSDLPEPFGMMALDARIRLDSVEPIHPDQRARYVREGWRPMLSSEGREVHLRTGQVVMVKPSEWRRPA